VKLLDINPRNIRQTVQALKAGGVVAHPADTCFGLAADLMNPKAVKKVQAIKGRDGKKPMSIMLPAAFQVRLKDYAKLTAFTRGICDKLLPGPVTILLPKGPAIPPWYFPETDLIGIRIPYDPFTQDLLNAFRGPLVTTSANLSGQPLCCSHEEIQKCFKNKKAKPDLIFEGEMDPDCVPSTVILPEKNRVRILRSGPVSAKELEGILGITVIV